MTPAILAKFGGGRWDRQKPPGMAALLGLDGEGVFDALHTLLQVLNLTLLLGQEEVFYSV